MTQRKSQIALEYMIVFSIVLVVFALLFATVATQRVQQQNRQLFSDEEIIAQSISAQLDRALQAGPGYTASVPLATAIGSVNYNLTITENGAVIVNSSIGGQVVQAISYSSVKSVLSNSTYLASNSAHYVLPIANGSLWIQNSFGTICVDYLCPAASGAASNVSLSEQVTHAANFNGQTSYITANQLPIPAGGSAQFAISLWAKQVGPSGNGARNTIISEYTTVTGESPIDLCSCWSGGVVFDAMNVWRITSPSCPALGTWNHYVITFNASHSGTDAYLYLNGALVASGYYASALTQNTVVIGAYNLNKNNLDFFNGSITNIQVYGISLSANQVQQLYQEGISGLPISMNSLATWWPLSGNAQDYSGSNNGNVIGLLTYTTVAQLFAKVTNNLGQSVTNTLVGFTASFGSFNGIGQAAMATNYTNANGIATAFLNQQGNNGQAYVEAVSFNGNTSLQSNLVGWWPLNLGQGSTAADLSGNANGGAMYYASWSDPNYVAQFNGQTSYITAPTLSVPTSQITISVWAKQMGTGSSGASNMLVAQYPSLQLSGCTGSGVAVFAISGVSTISAGPCPALGTWNHYVGTYDGTTMNLYLNGVLIATSPGGPMASPSNPFTIGARSAAGVYSSYFNGSIADLQVYNTALSAGQVQQLYQEGIASPPVSPSSGNLLGWWPLDGDANDYSGNGNNGIIFGNLNFVSTSSIPSPNTNVTSMFTGNFNGASSYVSQISSPTTSTTFTASAWINPTSVSSSYAIMGERSGTAGTWAFYVRPTGQIGLSLNTYADYSSTSANLIPNTWQYVTAVVSGTALTLYDNGVAIYTTTMSHSVAYDGTALGIGSQAGTGWNTGFSGLIGNAQIYGTALSASQVQQLYQEGISGLPLSGAGLVGWWPLDGNAQDYSSSGNSGTAIAVNYISQQVTKPYLISSLNSYGANFNGATSAIGTSQLISFPSQLTVSAWAKQVGPGPVGGANTIVSEYNTFLLSPCEAGTAYFYMFTLGRINAGTCPALGTWNNYVSTYDGSNMALYINGVRVYTYTPHGTPYAPIRPIVIGAWNSAQYPSSPFNGSISDVQVYNTALTASQVKQLYQSQMPPYASASVPLGWMP
jgi:hypothetical protein